MLTIWKFNLRMADRQEVPLPVGAKILRIGMQHDKPRLWAMVDPDEQRTSLVTLVYCGTGQPFDPAGKEYIDTIFFMNGDFVFHVFRLVEK